MLGHILLLLLSTWPLLLMGGDHALKPAPLVLRPRQNRYNLAIPADVLTFGVILIPKAAVLIEHLLRALVQELGTSPLRLDQDA